MATRKATPRMSPSLPSGKWMAIGLATLAASTAVIVAVGYNALDSDSGRDTRSTGSTANVSTSADQERRLSPTGNQGFRDFDPDIVYPNVAETASSERKLSPTGNQGFRDFDPNVVTPNATGAVASVDKPDWRQNASMPSRAELLDFDLSNVPGSAARELSPTGNQGFRDFDPAVLYPNVAASVSSERKLSPTGRQGFRDFDPEILYPNQ